MLPVVRHALQAPGESLDLNIRAFMESRFNYDFSHVRIHTTPTAAASARAVGAQAYTLGPDIVFAHDQYAPSTRAGRRLIAHELTHVVQQRSASNAEAGLAPADRALEAEAKDVSERGDRPFVPVQARAPSRVLQRQPAAPTDDTSNVPSAREVRSQPSPEKFPSGEVQAKDTTAEPEQKEGSGLTATLGTETEVQSGKQGISAEATDKFSLELAIPITERLKLGPLLFLKEASLEGSGGFRPVGFFPKPLTGLELEASVKVLSLEWEKVKVPLGVADFEISGSALGSAGYEIAESRSTFQVGFAGEAEAKFRPGARSPFFVTAKVGVERTYSNDGGAEFKWGPVTWKGFVGTGFEY